MAMEEQEFFLVFNSLFSDDIGVRLNAESRYNETAAHTRLINLVAFMKNTSVNDALRKVAASHLKKLIAKEFDDSYKLLSKKEKTKLRSELLSAVEAERCSTMRRRVSAVIAELANKILDYSFAWPELQKFIVDFATREDPVLKESALYIFTLAPGILGVKNSPHFDSIEPMLVRGMTDTCYTVRYQAIRGFCSFVTACDDATSMMFEKLCPYLLQNIYQSIQRQDNKTVLKSITNLIELNPRILRNYIKPLLQICTQAADNFQLPFVWRHLILKVITALAKAVPDIVRRSGYTTLIFSTLIDLLIYLDYNGDWSDESNIIMAAAEERLRTLAVGLGGTRFIPHLSSTLPEMLESPDWKQRHAALLATAAISKGCHPQLEPMLPSFMRRIFSLLYDSHPAVRCAACQTIGQISKEFQPLFAIRFHKKVVPELLMVMGDNDLHVQAGAMSALANFGQTCPSFIFARHLDNVMEKLHCAFVAKLGGLVERGTPGSMVIEQIVLTVAALARVSDTKVLDYYDRFMPFIKDIIHKSATPPLTRLRGKAAYCACVLGFFAGAEKFKEDGSEIMGLILDSEFEELESNAYLITSWRKMSLMLETQINPYLPLIMPQILRVIGMGIEEESGDDDEIYDELFYDTNRAQLLVECSRLLAHFARNFNESFSDFIEEALILFAPLLAYSKDGGVRCAAAKALPSLLECAKSKGLEFAQDMWVIVLQELFKAVQEETKKGILIRQLMALSECIESLGFDCLMAEPLRVLQKTLGRLFHGYFSRTEARKKTRKDTNLDDEDKEDLASKDKEDFNVLCNIIGVVRALLVAYQSSSVLIPALESFMPYFTQLLKNDRSCAEQKLGISVFNDIIEFTRGRSVKFHELFLKEFYDFLKHESPEVRREAARGWALLGTRGTEIYSIACCQALPALIELITALDSKLVDNIKATETAISAVTKILKYNCSEVLVAETLPQWISWFPVFEEENEAVDVYGYLCDLFEAGSTVVTNYATLIRIIPIIAEVFDRHVVSEESEVYRRMVNMVNIINSENPKCINECLDLMEPDHQRAILQVLRTS